MIYMLCMRQCEIIQPPLIVEAKVHLSGIEPFIDQTFTVLDGRVSRQS